MNSLLLFIMLPMTATTSMMVAKTTVSAANTADLFSSHFCTVVMLA